MTINSMVKAANKTAVTQPPHGTLAADAPYTTSVGRPRSDSMQEIQLIASTVISDGIHWHQLVPEQALTECTKTSSALESTNSKTTNIFQRTSSFPSGHEDMKIARLVTSGHAHLKSHRRYPGPKSLDIGHGNPTT